MEACQHQQKKDTHSKDGLRGSSGGTQITSTTKYTTAGNQTIYAQWQIITYQVTYNANSGTGAPGLQTKTWGQALQLSSQKPTRNGYTFVNWNTQANGTGTSYNAGAKYTVNAELKLYAQWKQDRVLATTAITPSTYGDLVNYSANEADYWRIFLNDGTNIYIITSAYVSRARMTLRGGISAGNGYYCVKGDLFSWLWDTSQWSKYANGISGLTGTATGGPTLEQFVKSYNNKKGTKYLEYEYQENGFISNITDTLYNPNVIGCDGCHGYWLLGENSSGMWGMSCDTNKLLARGPTYGSYGIRPLVCLPSGIYAKKENDKWTFSK